MVLSYLSTIVIGIFIILSSIFFKNQINLLSFVTGNFLGGATFIVGIKLAVNIPTLIKEKFKTY